MISKQNIGKFFMVVFLTLLIWVWADLSQDAELSVEVTLTADNEASPTWWMAFRQQSGALSQSIHLEELVLKGPAATIQRLDNERSLTALGLTVSSARFGASGTQTFSLLPFLRDQDSIRRQGVTVESCTPATIEVEVKEMELVENLPVYCFDGEGNRLENVFLNPTEITAYVPKSWNKDQRCAKVILKRDQWAAARTAPVKRTPHIEVMRDQFRVLNKQSIEIVMSPAEDNREKLVVTGGRLAFVLGNNILNKYRVVLDTTDLPELISTISVSATKEACKAYEDMRYHVYIEVLDAEPLEQQLPLKYNFPLEYYRKGEIDIDQSPRMASFHLVPLASPQTD